MRSLLLLTTLAWATSCSVYRRIDVGELKNLDGYDAHNEQIVYGQALVSSGGRLQTMTTESVVTDRPFRMIDRMGRTIDFNSRSHIGFLLASGRTPIQPWRSISLADGRLFGIPLLPNGDRVDAPWAEVRGAYFSDASFSRTGGLLTLIGAPLLAGGIAWFLASDTSHSVGAIIGGSVLVTLGGVAVLNGLVFGLLGLARGDASGDDLEAAAPP